MIPADKKCAKPGCGAKRLIGQPCQDFDCPQQFISSKYDLIKAGWTPPPMEPKP